MNCETLSIPEVKLFTARKFTDDRGYFCETYRDSWLRDLGVSIKFNQDNQSFSTKKGTLRGLHFQTGPSVQAKLVRCIQGAVYDVAVDIRIGSPTYGKYVGAELTEDNNRQILVPHGFAHAYFTLTPKATVLYKVDNYYDNQREDAIIWNDPEINVDWPRENNDVFVSAKDSVAKKLSDLPKYFIFDTSQQFNVRCNDLNMK